jgi:hypothetical protein
MSKKMKKQNKSHTCLFGRQVYGCFKNVRTYLSMCLLLITLGISAQTELSEKEQNSLDELINSSISVEADALKNQSFSEVLDAEFYTVQVTYLHMGLELNSDIMVAKHAGNFSKFYSVDELLPFIKSSYEISSVEQATEFEKVIDELFPVFYNGDKEMYQKDKEWFFIRNESFGEKEGVVVTVDDKGKIIDIEYKGGIE